MSCSKTDSNFWRRPLCCSILNVHRSPIREIAQTRQIVSFAFDLILKKTSLSAFLASCKHCVNSRLNCTAWKPCESKCSRKARGRPRESISVVNFQISSWEWGSARLSYILVWSMLNRKYRRRSQSLFLFPTDLGRSKRLCSQGTCRFDKRNK